MVAIRLSGMITETRELRVNLPDDLPAGPVEIIIQPQTSVVPKDARQTARDALAAAGLLGDAHLIRSDVPRPSEEAVREAGRLRPGERPMHERIDEERGDR